MAIRQIYAWTDGSNVGNRLRDSRDSTRFISTWAPFEVAFCVMPAPRKLRVAVLFGGRSAEHEISLLSARNVVEALDRDRFEPVLIGIDKSGRWLLQEEALLLGAARDPRLVKLNPSMPDVTLAAHPGANGAGALTIGAAAAAGIDGP